MDTALDGFFKWKVGDSVSLKQDPDMDLIGLKKGKARLLIVERLLQECHGGRQVIYAFRAFNNGNGAAALIHLTEVELEDYAPPKAREEEA